MRFSNSLKWLAAIAVLAVGTADLAAQSNATLMGRITDATGAAVSGAQVVITNQVTGSQHGGLSQADGRYTVSRLRAGVPYLVDIRMIGFGRQAVDDVTLAAGQTMTLDFRLSQEAIAIDALEVFATRAIERKTPGGVLQREQGPDPEPARFARSAFGPERDAERVRHSAGRWSW